MGDKKGADMKLVLLGGVTEDNAVSEIIMWSSGKSSREIFSRAYRELSSRGITLALERLAQKFRECKPELTEDQSLEYVRSLYDSWRKESIPQKVYRLPMD